MRRVKLKEWAWVIVFAALVMALTCVPYIVGVVRSDSAWRFSGFVIAVEDGNSYLAKMQLGAHGQWLLQLSYAIEEHPPSLVYPFFILLGKLIGWMAGTGDALRLHDALVFGYHAARVVFGFALVLVTYRFIAELLPHVRQRRLALIVIVLGGGLGWLLLVLQSPDTPLEFYSPEAFTFLHLYSLPHLAAARALMLGGMLFYLWAVRGHWAWGLAAGGSWFLLTLLQPFYMLIVYTALGLHVAVLAAMAFRQGEHELTRGMDLGAVAVRALWVSAFAGSFGVPITLYTFLLFQVDPIYSLWGAQNIIVSPPPWHYLLAWGLLIAGAVFGLRSLYRRHMIAWAFIAGWLLIVPLLLYVPYNLQRRFAEGAQVPLAAMALLGLTVGIGKGRARRWAARYAPLALIALVLPGTALVWAGGLIAALNPQEPVYHTHDQAATYAFLGKSLPPRAVVMSSYEFGNAAPAYGYFVSYIGHGPETPYLSYKKDVVQQLYRGSTPTYERRDLYNGAGAPYLIIGPHEKALGSFNPARDAADYMHMVFQSGEYSVWALK
ncbi:MAG: hypothetical protein FJ030_01280 [Chloroflexi bacterium]|nr:hypothetical protein [Chloroflexota bacterium]